MSHTVLIIEDDAPLKEKLVRTLEGGNCRVATAESGRVGLKALEAGEFDVVLTETRVPGFPGLTFLEELSRRTDAVVIVLTSRGSIKEAVGAVRLGALDYLLKPFSPEELLVTVERALDVARIHRENHRLRNDITSYFGREHMIGESVAMGEVFRLIDRVSATDASILILGESGTGKELVASTIHYQGARRDRPLVRVNCAALPDALVESELFGHEKGAFTGAVKSKVGRFEQADGGTIFLDEIGELSPPTQAKLLRVLQEKSFERVGGLGTIAVDVRAIAATNRDLEAEVAAGSFRRDLFFRLNVIPITVPPLRDRKTDIPLFIEHFLKRYEQKTSRVVRFSDEAIRVLMRYEYPGNVRELENLVERCATLAATRIVRPGDLPPFLTQPGSTGPLLPLSRVVKHAERDYLFNVLEFTGWNRMRAAEILGISRKNLWEKIKLYGITR